MERIEQEHWYYTHNELWQFHSFDDEPAIVIESYENVTYVEWEEKIETWEWYKARYKDWELHRENWPAVIRDSWVEFYYVNGKEIWA